MQDEPPQLDRTGGAHKYSKLMDDFVRQCLQKDPEKRPTADKLLSHGFFKQAKQQKYLISAILAGLPPLADRQERRRLASIHSTQHYLSWDFGTISSRTATPNLESLDPFRNFTGVVSLPSPHGSVRSTKLFSIDGHHVLAADEDDTSLMRRFSSYDELLGKEAAMQGSVGRRRGRSVDALAHRKSVSFESTDGGKAGGEADVFSSTVGQPSLAPIQASPMVSPAQQPENGEEPPKLRLSSDANTTPQPSATEEKPEALAPPSQRPSSGSNSTTSERLSSKQRSVSSMTTATLTPNRSEDEKSRVAAPSPPSHQGNVLQRTASRLRGDAGAEPTTMAARSSLVSDFGLWQVFQRCQLEPKGGQGVALSRDPGYVHSTFVLAY